MRICNDNVKQAIKFSDLKPGDVFLFVKIEGSGIGYSEPSMIIEDEDQSGNYKFVELREGYVTEIGKNTYMNIWPTPDSDVVKLNCAINYTILGNGQ